MRRDSATSRVLCPMFVHRMKIAVIKSLHQFNFPFSLSFFPQFLFIQFNTNQFAPRDENKTSSVVWTTAAAGRESRILFSYYFFVLASVSHGRSRGTYSRPTNASLSPFYYFQKVSDDDDWSVEINVSSNIPSASVTRRRDRTTHLKKKENFPSQLTQVFSSAIIDLLSILLSFSEKI